MHDPPPLVKNHIGAETRMISNLVHRLVNYHPFGDDAVSGTNGRILGFLAQMELSGKDVFQRDLEETFQVRRATVSKIICLMEQKGLIERRPVPQDARLKKIVLTEKGRRTHEENIAHFDRIEELLRKGIPQEKLDVFFEVCGMIKKNLSEVNDENPID
jgi:DNA-binding MarR family transcriptional regulator